MSIHVSVSRPVAFELVVRHRRSRPYPRVYSAVCGELAFRIWTLFIDVWYILCMSLITPYCFSFSWTVAKTIETTAIPCPPLARGAVCEETKNGGRERVAREAFYFFAAEESQGILGGGTKGGCELHSPFPNVRSNRVYVTDKKVRP